MDEAINKLPEIWGKTGMQEPNVEFRVSELPSDVKSKIATALDAVPDSQYDGIAKMFGDGDKAVTEATEGLGPTTASPVSSSRNGNTSTRPRKKSARRAIGWMGACTRITKTRTRIRRICPAMPRRKDRSLIHPAAQARK
ncbi:hypothetical protein [Pseudomonas sp. MYb541]|uniref:hypothetical protein n=1 Tax=Pseudomonas sp. MYb541 TaxID=2745402 RepID=UPI00403FA822